MIFNSKIFYQHPHPPPSNPCPDLTSLGFASDWSQEIKREIEREREREREIKKDIYIYRKRERDR